MKKFFMMAAATLSLTACSNSDDPVDQTPSPVIITASIGAETRAYDTTWEAGDAIGITTERKGVNKYINEKYTVSNAGEYGEFSGTAMYFQDKTEPVDFIAYYPFTGTEGQKPGNDGIISATTSSEYQETSMRKNINYLWDKKTTAAGEDHKVNFTFSHKMSKLTLTFKVGSGANLENIKSYSISGLYLDGTFNTATGVAAATTTGSATTGTIEMENLALNPDHNSVTPLILFPQEIKEGQKIRLTIKAQDNSSKEMHDYGCDLFPDDDKLEAGKHYKYTITINKTSLNVNSSTIVDWVEEEKAGNATLE